ncbi:IS110 family transposase, partial [Escherichia coli]|nr:IS110 family transposase [Escherichia coli]
EWVMEACGTAHYWGRLAQSLGHQVRLLHPRYVRPYRRRNKTDRNDCDAMLEAARCTDIHPVPVKSHDQQQLQQLHGLRETWKKSRTQRINLLRGILREAGIEAPTSTAAFIRAASELVDQPELASLSRLLHIVLAEINLDEQCMAECEQQLKRWHADDEIVRKLDEVSGIGLLTASALTAAVGKPERFASGRQLSAWLGMTPREFSSGNSRKLGHISRQGNVYVRTLLIHGSRAALLAA